MASKKLSTDTSLANSYKLSRGVASVARPSAPTIGTATDGGTGNMSVTFTASTLGPTASSFSLTSSSGVTGSGASSPLTLQEVATGTYTYSVSGVNANGTGPSSAASNSVVVASLFAPSGAYDSIATASPSAGTSYIDFTSIPSTYTHLQIRGIARSNDASAGNNLGIYARFNSDSGSNYAFHFLTGNGSTAGAAALASQTEMFWNAVNPRGGDTANVYSANVIDILDYANTNKYKTVRTLSGDDLNGSGVVRLNSALWMSTAAVSSIRIFMEGNFAANSQLALYGIKGA